jgi:uncharacterized NAD(P)/FAD-binding protein YdhS/predicted metal-dependent enzyme (double-stranded beta helix superfamily)
MTDPNTLSPRLRGLIDDLAAAGDVVSRAHAVSALGRADVGWDDVAPFVSPSPHGYARVRIARTDPFEVLVMTWMPGQGSVPHDHAGSICALRIVRGHVRESFFAPAADGLVDLASSSELVEDEVIVDASDHIHSLRNDPERKEPLVTLHVYAPPLPELRRFAPRSAETPLPAVFTRTPAPGTPRVAIVGGGFSGTMVAAHLAELATANDAALHIVVHDRQASFGEGPAYRTADARHLLNVPASNMSVWPDRPTHFVEWARQRDPAVAPGDFLPRKRYGEYVRDAFAAAATSAGPKVSMEVRRDEVVDLTQRARGWSIETRPGAPTEVDAVVLATGHRPPDDPLRDRWEGPRARYVEDPWASLALSAVRPDETVVLLGTGLTAVDVYLTLNKVPRTAPVIALARRGLVPQQHATAPRPPLDPRGWLDPLLATPGGPSARGLVRALRAAIARARAEGEDWRPVIDGLRPHHARIWKSLSVAEASRFLRHVRPFWEVRRHRMAPKIGAAIDDALARGALQILPGRVLSARATTDGVTLSVRPRGETNAVEIRADWVVNCTGPGLGAAAMPPVIVGLVQAGVLEPDVHGLGVLTDAVGHPIARGAQRDDLVVVGTLRKADLWESTAVPELRVQAASAAREIARHLGVLRT